MHRSFEYYDRPPAKPDVPEPVRDEERLVRSFAEAHPDGCAISSCRFCGSADLAPAFAKNGVRYSCCGRCGALLANISEDGFCRYEACAELGELRRADGYQEAVCELGSQPWDELCEWTALRCLRHLGRIEGLTVADVGDRYEGLREKLRASKLCGQLLDEGAGAEEGAADVAICVDLLQRCADPLSELGRVRGMVRPGGLVVLGFRMGTSFDVLALGPGANILPYEHSNLPSEKSIELLLERSGLEPLDIATTGESQLWWVLESKDDVDVHDRFVRHVLNNADEQTLGLFQHFLQNAGYGEYVRVAARRPCDE